MWLNQNFLLPDGVESPDVTFNLLRGGGLLSFSMASNGQVHANNNNCGFSLVNSDYYGCLYIDVFTTMISLS